MQLVPYKELPLQISQADLHVCQYWQVEFDNDRSVIFVYLTDRTCCVQEGPFHNLYLISQVP